jgi:hypothetical protein
VGVVDYKEHNEGFIISWLIIKELVMLNEYIINRKGEKCYEMKELMPMSTPLVIVSYTKDFNKIIFKRGM